jgi:hypothetical protein
VVASSRSSSGVSSRPVNRASGESVPTISQAPPLSPAGSGVSAAGSVADGAVSPVDPGGSLAAPARYGVSPAGSVADGAVSPVDPAGSLAAPALPVVFPAGSVAAPRLSRVRPADSLAAPAGSGLSPTGSVADGVVSADDPTGSVADGVVSAVDPAGSVAAAAPSGASPTGSVAALALSRAHLTGRVDTPTVCIPFPCRPTARPGEPFAQPPASPRTGRGERVRGPRPKAARPTPRRGGVQDSLGPVQDRAHLRNWAK